MLPMKALSLAELSCALPVCSCSLVCPCHPYLCSIHSQPRCSIAGMIPVRFLHDAKGTGHNLQQASPELLSQGREGSSDRPLRGRWGEATLAGDALWRAPLLDVLPQTTMRQTDQECCSSCPKGSCQSSLCELRQLVHLADAQLCGDASPQLLPVKRQQGCRSQPSGVNNTCPDPTGGCDRAACLHCT